MPVVPFIGPAIGLAGSLIGANASKKASQQQAQAAQAGIDTQMAMYNQTRSDLAPYLQTGNQALSQLANLFGLSAGGNGVPNAAAATQALTQFPGFQFGMNQGIEALDRSAASRGMVLSGGQRRDITQFGTDYAMQQAWAPYVSQLNTMAQMGQNAGAQTGAFGQQTASGVAQSHLQQGQAQAAGTVGQANQFTGLLSQVPGMVNTVYKGTTSQPLGGGFSDPNMDGLYKLSDARLKEDIVRVGATDEGLSIYTYRLKGTDGPTEMGVMAQEVEAYVPEAVKTLRSGVKVVDYSKLTSPLAEFLKAA